MTKRQVLTQEEFDSLGSYGNSNWCARIKSYYRGYIYFKTKDAAEDYRVMSGTSSPVELAVKKTTTVIAWSPDEPEDPRMDVSEDDE